MKILENGFEAATTIDKVEAAIVRAIKDFPEIFKFAEMPLVHRFTPGLYSRQITMPVGATVASMIHKTEHQFLLSKGIVSFWTPEEGEIIIEAPFHGITKPGTRRVLYIHEEAIWTTFHSTLLTTPDEIVADITEKYDNPILGGHLINNVFHPADKNIGNS